MTSDIQIEFQFNVVDPRISGVKTLVRRKPGQSSHEAYAELLAALDGYYLARPQPTERHTADRLIEMGFVGVYWLGEAGGQPLPCTCNEDCPINCMGECGCARHHAIIIEEAFQ